MNPTSSSSPSRNPSPCGRLSATLTLFHAFALFPAVGTNGGGFSNPDISAPFGRRRLAPPPTPCLARTVENVIISPPALGALSHAVPKPHTVRAMFLHNSLYAPRIFRSFVPHPFHPATFTSSASAIFATSCSTILIYSILSTELVVLLLKISLPLNKLSQRDGRSRSAMADGGVISRKASPSHANV